MKNNQLAIGLTILVVAIIGFLGGMKYGQGRNSGFMQFGNGQNRTGSNGQFGNRQGMMAGRGGQIIGEVLNADSKSVTVKLSDGSSKIILLSANTSIVKTSIASSSDLTVGTKVGVFGQTNSDGTVTAQNIQLNPQQRIATPSATLGK